MFKSFEEFVNEQTNHTNSVNESTKESVAISKEISDWVKKNYPKYKFKFKISGFNTINIRLTKADFDPFVDQSIKVKQINPYDIRSNDDITEDCREFLIVLSDYIFSLRKQDGVFSIGSYDYNFSFSIIIENWSIKENEFVNEQTNHTNSVNEASKESVDISKEISDWVKKNYPKYKFKFKISGFNTINIRLTKADFNPFVDQSIKVKQINPYDIKSNDDITEDCREFLIVLSDYIFSLRTQEVVFAIGFYEYNFSFSIIIENWEYKRNIKENEFVNQLNNDVINEKSYNDIVGSRHKHGLGAKDIVNYVKDYLKKTYPKYKFNTLLKTAGYNHVISVSLLEADFEAFVNPSKKYKTVKNHSISVDKELTEECRELLEDVFDYINSYNYNSSDSMRDYVDIGFYIEISVGNGNSEYKKTIR